MTDKRYWLWLQMCLGEGTRFKEIIDEFGSVEKLYHANIIEWKMSASLTPKQVMSLQKYALNDTERIIYECENNHWQIICFDDEKYPDRLREISNPPAVLYVDGVMADFDDYVTIGIVGTRKASPYAKKAAFIMSKGVSLCGVLTVSGGALGVDSSAHRGSLAVHKKTYAVLGCGLGTAYLQVNQQLRNDIKANGGALITEFPPFTRASKYTFPIRNRIISGLSLGVLVVEAGVKSGSLITAKYATEQGRDIYAVPASVFDYNFYGSNKLIDDGAVVATSPSILIEGYAERFGTLDMSQIKTVRELLEAQEDKSANAQPAAQYTFDNIAKDRAAEVAKDRKILELTGDEKTLYNVLSDKFDTIDAVIEKSGMESKRVLVALTMLEMKGIIETASGKRYRLK